MTIKDNHIDLNELFAKQFKLDEYICNEHGIEHRDQLQKLVRALKVEISEAVNIWEGFKFWKRKKKNNRQLLLEEYVDGLHFFLSIGNIVDALLDHDYVDKRKTVLDQLDALDFELLRVTEPIHWTFSFALYRGLSELWGFTWDEVLAKYDEKYQINIERQQNGY